MKTEFKIGDVVEAHGCRGIVTEVITSADYSIVAKFENEGYLACYTHDGKHFAWHKEPSLKFIVEKRLRSKSGSGFIDAMTPIDIL